MVKLQLAMDTLDGDEALGLAASIAPYADIIEAGTPLIKSVGINIVKKLKSIHPEKIILAGGLSNMDIYSRLNKLTKKYCRKELRKYVKIVKNKLGDSAGIYGAGALVFHT